MVFIISRLLIVKDVLSKESDIFFDKFCTILERRRNKRERPQEGHFAFGSLSKKQTQVVISNPDIDLI